jgi:hypothetical protein
LVRDFFREYSPRGIVTTGVQAMNSYFPRSISIRSGAGFPIFVFVVMATMLSGCATVSVTPQPIRPPEPAAAMNAIEAEPTYPTRVEVRDFDFAVNAVTENRSPLHRGIDLFRQSSADQRQDAIGRDVGEVISKETAKNWTKPAFMLRASPGTSILLCRATFFLSLAA